MSEKQKDVHTEHCCIHHGCKYGEQECSVVTGLKKQSYWCESCEYDRPMDFTVIYGEYVRFDTYVPRIKHIIINLNEKIYDAVERYGIPKSNVYFILKGHCENA